MTHGRSSITRVKEHRLVSCRENNRTRNHTSPRGAVSRAASPTETDPAPVQNAARLRDGLRDGIQSTQGKGPLHRTRDPMRPAAMSDSKLSGETVPKKLN